MLKKSLRLRCYQALVLFSLILAAASARDARAQQVDIQAQASIYVGKGLQSQEAGRYDEAIAFYKAAYDLLPHPDLLFNLGQAHRLKGERVAALDYYRKYIALQPGGRAAKEARRWTEQLEQDMKKEAAAEAERRAEAERLAAEARQAEAARKAESVREAKDAEKKKAVQGNTPNQSSGGSASTATTTSFEARRRGVSKDRIAALSLGVAGATTIAVGIYFRARSVEKTDALQQLLKYSNPSLYERGRARTLFRQAERYDSYEENLLLVGGSALIIGTTLWMLGQQPSSSGPASNDASIWRKPAALVLGSLGVAGIAAGWHFFGEADGDEERDYYGDIREDNNLARDHGKGFVVAGSAFLAAGTYLLLTSPPGHNRKQARASARSLIPTLESHSAGFLLSGQF